MSRVGCPQPSPSRMTPLTSLPALLLHSQAKKINDANITTLQYSIHAHTMLNLRQAHTSWTLPTFLPASATVSLHGLEEPAPSPYPRDITLSLSHADYCEDTHTPCIGSARKKRTIHLQSAHAMFLARFWQSLNPGRLVLRRSLLPIPRVHRSAARRVPSYRPERWHPP